MTGLIVVGIIILLIAIVLCTRAAVTFTYSHEGAKLTASIGIIKLDLLPKKTKKKVAKKAVSKTRKTEKRKKKDEEEKKGGNIGFIKELLPIITDTLGRLRRKLTINTLVIHFTFAGEDPAKTALNFGRASFGSAALIPVLERCFVIRHRDVRTGVSFTEKENLIYVKAKISIAIGSVLYIAIRFGFKFLVLNGKRKRENTDKRGTSKKVKQLEEAKENGKTSLGRLDGNYDEKNP